MKRLFSIFFITLILGGLLISPAMAAEEITDRTIYYEDGSYAVIALDHCGTRSNADKFQTYTYYNPLGQKCFAYTLYATFTYNGVTSQADSCKGGVVIYREGWTLSTHSEYVSGNTAYGRATFTGPNGESRTASLTLTCDKNGNVT